jgi:hypothetical protein
MEFWKKGKKYLVRTVTHYTVGELVEFSDDELVFKSASWVADTGRFHNALRDGELSEVEPFTEPVLVNRKAIVDATIWTHDLPTEQK